MPLLRDSSKDFIWKDFPESGNSILKKLTNLMITQQLMPSRAGSGKIDKITQISSNLTPNFKLIWLLTKVSEKLKKNFDS